MADNLVLTGFMGTGKTTIGALVADLLDMAFVDADEAITARAGADIPTLFARDGEAAFRTLERAVIRDLIAGRRQVIATGGGALIHPETRAEVLARNLVVCLTADRAVIQTRLEHEGGRPLAGQWEAIYEARRPVYESFAHRFDTTHAAPDSIAQEIADLWHRSR
jgi:shikimate kinase